MRPGAAHIALCFAYVAAAVNGWLTVVDLLERLWLTAGLQILCAALSVVMAYGITRGETVDVPPPRGVERLASAASYALVVVGMFTVALILHTILHDGFK